MNRKLLLYITAGIVLHNLTVFFSLPAVWATGSISNTYLLWQEPLVLQARVTGPDGVAIAGAQVQVKGSRRSALTDSNGIFRISVPDSTETLHISFLGYTGLEIKVAAIRQGQTVTLQPAAQQLQEVVVSTGYQDLPTERVTGSFTQVNNELLNRRVGADIISRLEDITPGVMFDRRSGGEPQLDIRSRGTIYANDQPLIVLDNFPYEGDPNNINPNDIESITVLRDAGAASIWGVRAGNGVIVINTKKGRLNQPLKAELNTNLTLGQKPRLKSLPWISSADYIDLEKDLFARGFYIADENYSSASPLTPVVELLIAARDGHISHEAAEASIRQMEQQDVRDDMLHYLYRSSAYQQYALNLSGGGQANRYYFSAGYDKNLQQVRGNDNDRLNLRASHSVTLFRRVELHADLLYTQSSGQNNGLAYHEISNGASKGIYPYAQLADAAGNPLRLVKNYRIPFTEEAFANGLLNWDYVPLDELAHAANGTRLADVRIQTGARYKFAKWINADLKYSYQRSSGQSTNLRNSDTYYTRDMVNRYSSIAANGSVTRPVPPGSILDQSASTMVSHGLRGQLNAGHKWGMHQLSAIAGMEVRELERKSSGSRVYGYDEEILTYNGRIDYSRVYTLYTNGTATIPFSNSPFRELYEGAVSYYANMAYTYRGTYSISGSARLDQTNLFGVKTNQKGVPLWSAGISWDIGREGFYKLSWLPGLRLRATYGYNGNVDNTLSAYTTALYFSVPAPSGLPYAEIANPPNPQLRWEKTRMANLGADFSALNGRIMGSIEFYTKKGTDLIGSAPLDATTGINSFRGNVANISGKGIDISINTINLKGKLNWQSNLLFSQAKDRVTRYLQPLANAVSYVTGGTGRNIIPFEGNAVFGTYSYRWAGLDPANGNPLGYLPDGTVTDDYVALQNTSPENLVYHGAARPVFFGSIRNTFTYRGFSFSANIAGRFAYYFHRTSVNYNSLFTTWNGHSDYALRWQQPGDEQRTTVPSMVYPASVARDNFYNGAGPLVEKGDHLRLQDVRLSHRWTKLRVGGASFRNLEVYLYLNNGGVLWSANSFGIDPESPVLPVQRTVAFGFRVDI